MINYFSPSKRGIFYGAFAPPFNFHTMAKRGRPISRYFMEQWTTNREMVIDDYFALDREEFKKKYHIRSKTYSFYFKKLSHKDNISRKEYIETVKGLVKRYNGLPKDAIDIIQNQSITTLKRAIFDTTEINT